MERRLLDLAEYAEEAPFNLIEWKNRSLGIITSGVVYTYVCDVFPDASILLWKYQGFESESIYPEKFKF